MASDIHSILIIQIITFLLEQHAKSDFSPLFLFTVMMMASQISYGNVPCSQQLTKQLQLDMGYWAAILPDFWWDAVNIYFFATLKMSNVFNCFLECSRFVKLLFERKFRNAMDGCVLPVAVDSE